MGDCCTATLTHAHGKSGCWSDRGHMGDHKTLCESCAEYGEVWLEWSEDHENWLDI